MITGSCSVKKTCGIGGPGGPVHDGRAPGLRDYMSTIVRQTP